MLKTKQGKVFHGTTKQAVKSLKWEFLDSYLVGGAFLGVLALIYKLLFLW